MLFTMGSSQLEILYALDRKKLFLGRSNRAGIIKENSASNRTCFSVESATKD
jgi:hypothetical protein